MKKPKEIQGIQLYVKKVVGVTQDELGRKVLRTSWIKQDAPLNLGSLKKPSEDCVDIISIKYEGDTPPFDKFFGDIFKRFS